jgi:hypothetical protein
MMHVVFNLYSFNSNNSSEGESHESIKSEDFNPKWLYRITKEWLL